MTQRTIQSLKCDENFLLFWGQVTKMTWDINVDVPVMPRLWNGLNNIGGIKAWFDQPGYRIYCKLEKLITKVAKKEGHEEFKFVTDFYKDDIAIGYTTKPAVMEPSSWFLTSPSCFNSSVPERAYRIRGNLDVSSVLSCCTHIGDASNKCQECTFLQCLAL